MKCWLILFLTAALLQGSGKIIKGTGTVKFVDLEGGFYGIITRDGQKLLPLNLPGDMKSDGTQVWFEAEVEEGTASTMMWGVPVKLRRIEKMASFTVTILFDNKSINPGYESGWGFSALIQTGNRNILFDTGCDGESLLHNLRSAGVKPEEIDTIVISHNHWDHTGGLLSIVSRARSPKVYLGKSFSLHFQQELEKRGAEVFRGDDWRQIADNVFITPELDAGIKEQALVLVKPERVLIITGCSHPGIDRFAEEVRAKFAKEIWIIGGFHLFASSRTEIERVAERLKRAGVTVAYPLHCSGEKAAEIFSRYMEVRRGGAGLKFEF